MNDLQIRKAFHRKILFDYHKSADSLVIDELGLQHGKYRADIAVITGKLIAYEIKSAVDSMRRLKRQIRGYNAVFDRVSIVVAECHLNNATSVLPEWWGVIVVSDGPRGEIYFKAVRRSKRNHNVDDFAVAQLLWRSEAQEILISLNVQSNVLRENRSELYGYIVKGMKSHELRQTVREYLMQRQNWRRLAQPFQRDGLSQPSAKL